MLKRKPSMTSFWLPVLAISLAHFLSPEIALSDTTATAPAQEMPHYMLLDEVRDLIPDLNFKVVNDTTIKLVGMVPHDCSSKIRVDSTALHSEVSAGGVQGFAIFDSGAFKSCMANAGKCSQGILCDALSTVQPNPQIVADPNKTLSVAYLNHAVRDVALNSNFDAIDLGKERLVLKSIQQKRQDEKDAADAASAKAALQLQQRIRVCAQEDLQEAHSLLSTAQGLDQDTIDALNKYLDAFQKRKDDKFSINLEKNLRAAIDAGDVDKFSDLEDQVYDYLRNPDVPDEQKEAVVARRMKDDGDKMASLLYQMAVARTAADDANDSSIDRAQEMLKRALDAEEGIKMNSKTEQDFRAAIRPGGALDNARVQIAYQQFENARDKRGAYDMWGRPVGATVKAYQHYQKMAAEMDKKLEKQEKGMKCIDKWGNPSEKRDSDHALDEACNRIEDERQELAEVPTKMEQMHAEAQQKAAQNAAARQLPAQGVVQQSAIPGVVSGNVAGGAAVGTVYPLPAGYSGSVNTGLNLTGIPSIYAAQNPAQYNYVNSSLSVNGAPTASVPFYFGQTGTR